MDPSADVPAAHSVAVVGMDSVFLVACAADEQLARRVLYLLPDYVVRCTGSPYCASEARTKQSIEEASAANHDVDADAKPVVAKAVYALGQVVLIVLKLLAGLLVFGLILGACALIIGLFAVGMAGPEVVSVDAGIWTVSLGIMTALVPVLLLIYVLMCLIASRKPSRRAVLTTFLIWILIIIGLGVSAVRERERGYEWYEIRTESYDPDMELPALPDPGSADNSLLRVDTPEGMVDLSAGEGRVKIAVEDKEDGEKVDIRVGSKGVKITATEPAAECDDFD